MKCALIARCLAPLLAAIGSDRYGAQSYCPLNVDLKNPQFRKEEEEPHIYKIA